jgi:hypothetical protein
VPEIRKNYGKIVMVGIYEEKREKGEGGEFYL